MSARTRLFDLEAILDASGVPATLAEQMPSGGRPRQLSPRTVLLGVALALSDGRPAQLTQAHKALISLRVADQLRLGIACCGPRGLHVATYRQFEDAHEVMMRAIDPSPVPSFKGVEEGSRGEHLEVTRRGIDQHVARMLLDEVVDALVEASVPDEYKGCSSALAIDWTDHETWSRPRAAHDPQPANDPDASWGHAKRNAPGAKDHLFFGYYAQVATMVKEEGGPPVPELVRRIAFSAPRIDPPRLMAKTLLRMQASGIELGDVLCDCGYSNRDPLAFATPLRGAGARLVMDLHPDDRGPRGTFEGAILANGALYCPATPVSLLTVGPLRRGAPADETADHDARCAELARYELSPVTSPDPDGYRRMMCPASAGKVRCDLKQSSMAGSFDHPTVLDPPDPSPRCCAQQTITVPPQVNEKTRQKHSYPGAAHRNSYTRRTAAERCYASLADPSVGGIRRGWSRLFGLAKNTLMYTLAVVARNMRIADSYERNRAGETRRKATGDTQTKRRRPRRHEREIPAKSEPPPNDGPAVPG